MQLSLLILAPDLERSSSRGGLDDAVGQLLSLASGSTSSSGAQVVFAMNRYRLGRACLRKVPVSAVGVLNYQGSEENVRKMEALLPGLRQGYSDKLEAAYNSIRPIQVEQEAAKTYYRYPIEDPSEEIRREFLLKIKGMVKSES